MDTYLTPDDVCLIPQMGIVKSRSDVDMNTSFLGFDFKLPILSANMDTVTERDMALSMSTAGGAGVIHRKMEMDDQVHIVEVLKGVGVPTFAAVGTCESERERIDLLVQAGVDVLNVDIAHGHSINMKNTLKYIRNNYNVKVIAGNVATVEGAKDLHNWGANAIKIGIGPGAACSTRRQTGYGVPQFSAVRNIFCSIPYLPIIADGGISHPGDAAKLIGAGATMVMVGSLFAGTDEAPGIIQIVDGKHVKKYRGMASVEVGSKYPEGVSGYVPYVGPVIKVLDDFENGLRSAVSYSGFSTLKRFRGSVKWGIQTNNGVIEGNPRI